MFLMTIFFRLLQPKRLYTGIQQNSSPRNRLCNIYVWRQSTREQHENVLQLDMSQAEKEPVPWRDPSAKGVNHGSAPSHNHTTGDGPLDPASTENSETDPEHEAQAKRDWRFWALLASISLAGLLTALEGTVTSTALPSIVNDLGGGHLYVWVVNGYLFAM